MLAEALEIDHQESSRIFNRFKQDDVKICLSNDKYVFESDFSNFPSNFITLSLVLKERFKKDDSWFYGKIESFDVRTGKVYFSTSLKLDTEVWYSVKFEANRSVTDSCLRALERVENYGLLKFFTTFDDEQIEMKPKRKIKPPVKWFQKKISEDATQKKAVMKIMAEEAYPYPFVLTGGPGTGKTSVVVETILQILDRKSFAKILVTCQSNSACDEIAMRLRSFVPAVKVFRFWGQSLVLKTLENKSKDSYYDTLVENSTVMLKSYKEPRMETLESYKVIVATMTIADRLIRRGFPNNHFDFIFVDECCAAIEPEALIPIVGLGMDKKKVNANIVLVGDENLLGPVLNSSLAASIGLGEFSSY